MVMSHLHWLAAEDTLLQDWEDAAHVNLANVSADGVEVGDVGWGCRWGNAIKVRNTKNIDVAA